MTADAVVRYRAGVLERLKAYAAHDCRNDRIECELTDAIGHTIKKRNPATPLSYVSAEKYILAAINWLRFDRVTSFRDHFRTVDVLLVDDITLRILYDHQLFSLQNAGGASRYHYELARYLGSVADARVELLLGLSGTVFPFRELASERTSVVQAESKKPPGPSRYILNEILGNGLSLLRGKLDIYHPTLYRRMPLVRSRKIVVTHHDCVYERFPELLRNPDRVIRAKRNSFAAADAVICVSESSRKDLVRFYGVDERKLHVIHHGLTRLGRDPAIADPFHSERPRPYVLYVGSRSPYKNFGGLLRAFAWCNLQEIFDLVAIGGGALRETERATARELGIEKVVQVYPVGSDALLAEAYANAELFVYPSLWEGFGFPPLEAMSLGCPVLVSNCSSLPEVCRDGATYFDPNDPGSLGRSLAEAVSLKSSDSPLIARGKEVAASYDWRRCGQQTLELYRACLGN